MPVNILIQRDRSDIPFGFKLQGGSDFSIPLSVQTVNENSIADRAGLRPGDAILSINNVETSWMDHARAKQEIIRAGNDILLTVDRNAVAIDKPKYTPLAELKCLPPQDPTTFSIPPPKKTDLTVQKEDSIKIGSSHNRAPMPFNKEVGSSMVYQSAKATNWQPGDYTKWVNPQEQQQQEQKPTVTAVFHNPYNTPIGLYSDDNVFDAFSHQTKGIINPEITTQSKGQPRPQPQPEPQQQHHQHQHQQYQQQQQQPYHVQSQQHQNQAPRGTNSLSMRMLNSALDTVEGTSMQAPSVFDLKRGNNPTGASVPRGFRSVQAPTLPPPEERHAPVRKEYSVSHVKQSWVEPKIN